MLIQIFLSDWFWIFALSRFRKYPIVHILDAIVLLMLFEGCKSPLGPLVKCAPTSISRTLILLVTHAPCAHDMYYTSTWPPGTHERIMHSMRVATCDLTRPQNGSQHVGVISPRASFLFIFNRITCVTRDVPHVFSWILTEFLFHYRTALFTYRYYRILALGTFS